LNFASFNSQMIKRRKLVEFLISMNTHYDIYGQCEKHITTYINDYNAAKYTSWPTFTFLFLSLSNDEKKQNHNYQFNY
jgi:hypothetical protein